MGGWARGELRGREKEAGQTLASHRVTLEIDTTGRAERTSREATNMTALGAVVVTPSTPECDMRRSTNCVGDASEDADCQSRTDRQQRARAAMLRSEVLQRSEVATNK